MVPRMKAECTGGKSKACIRFIWLAYREHVHRTEAVWMERSQGSVSIMTRGSTEWEGRSHWLNSRM